MKVFIFGMAVILVFSMFMVFQADNDGFLHDQQYLKSVADDCSNAAALYYDQEKFADGVKVFNRTQGNTAIWHILENNLHLNNDLTSQDDALKTPFCYYTYYFDGNGAMTSYEGDTPVSHDTVTFPYLFREARTGYEQMIYEPTVIVTIDAGAYNYRLSSVKDPELIRTSGYEYRERQ